MDDERPDRAMMDGLFPFAAVVAAMLATIWAM